MRMRDVRPKHIRALVLDLRKSNVHRRGTGKGLGTEKLAPRTVRHIYSLIRRMFSAAVIDEVIEASPVVVAKGVLRRDEWGAEIFRRSRCSNPPFYVFYMYSYM
jgi:hypothetical protein